MRTVEHVSAHIRRDPQKQRNVSVEDPEHRGEVQQLQEGQAVEQQHHQGALPPVGQGPPVLPAPTQPPQESKLTKVKKDTCAVKAKMSRTPTMLDTAGRLRPNVLTEENTDEQKREGVDGVVHGAVARHHAPVAQQHDEAGQAVQQGGQGGRRVLETQEAHKRPL
ncbi:hypothetical protein EYF80_038110 [Liparis tanakae]|uniref:Uncharacterized protein n=1 Tax=Liparis tanakae TaxID=230148 RepID=A0A4Z2GDT8_9TELE|nr:hypothetical protein EYF80_038110 [Liparis tanakae]